MHCGILRFLRSNFAIVNVGIGNSLSSVNKTGESSFSTPGCTTMGGMIAGRGVRDVLARESSAIFADRNRF